MKHVAGTIALAVVVAGLGAGCGSSGKAGSSASSATTVSSPTTISAPTSGGATHPTTTRPGTPRHATTLSPADVAQLQRELGAAGSSLTGADQALSQTDPNQTKNEEGTTP